MRLWRSKSRSAAGEVAQAAAVDLGYVRRPGLLLAGNHVQLLRRGSEAFPAMLAAIAEARSQVHFETYILRSDATGERFKQALIERALAGVKVRLLFDSVGSFNLVADAYLGVLANAGVEILEYRPVTPWRRKLMARLRALSASAHLRRGAARQRDGSHGEPARWRLNRRDHQKITVIDGRVAFAGGLNVGDEYGPWPDGTEWHDLEARVEGPAAVGLAQSFRRAWLDGGGAWFPPPADPPLPRAAMQPMLAHTCDNFGMRNRSRMHADYRHAIRCARNSIAITCAYFIPDQLLRWALYHAVDRGVEVRVIVPGKSDVPVVRYASRYLFARLLRRGVRIFEYPERMMHAKAAVIDGVWATVGSFNLDHRSMVHNLEAGVVVLDPDFAASVGRQFEADVAICSEVRLDAWGRRPWTQRSLEWCAHLFAYWL